MGLHAGNFMPARWWRGVRGDQWLGLAAGFAAMLCSTLAHAELTLTSDLPTGQLVGTTVTWTVAGVVETSRVQLRAGRLDAPVNERLRVKYDYSNKSVMTWTPLEDGIYQIVVSVIDEANPGTRTTLTQFFRIDPRTTGRPVVNPTNHPLVALYSARPCAAGRLLAVEFKEVSGGPVSRTPQKSCDADHSMNFLIAGMKPETTYVMRHQLFTDQGGPLMTGPRLFYTTDSVGVPLPAVTITVPETAEASRVEPIILWSPAGSEPIVATDTDGNPLWYYSPVPPGSGNWQLMRPTSAETMLLIGDDLSNERIRLREIDLAGNIIRETTAYRLSKQSRLTGGIDPLTTFHHEARLLANGHTAVLLNVERIYEDVQGDGIVDILGDVVMVLDENWQRVWEWNAYDHLDINRLATLGESCIPQGPGCPGLYQADIANDWTHGNAIAYSPSDGDLIISLRHWDAVLKVDYADGSGTGAVEWELGMFGDFTPISDVPWPWATHQHDSGYVADNVVVVYDNGNAEQNCVEFNECNSRGLVYFLDENAMTARLILSADLANYSFAVGSAQALRNGNFAFHSGFYDGGFTARTHEVDADGKIIFEAEIGARMYRSFRMQDLYTPPPDGGP